MKTVKKFAAIGMCGLMLGGIASTFAAPTANARIFSLCDQKIAQEEKQAAKAFEKGKLSAEDYAKVLAEIAYHRELWGC